MSNIDKNFILGVGCQKGGTSWLYQQLKKSQFVDMGFTKEYHVFDALYVPRCNNFFNNKINSLKDAITDKGTLSQEHSKLIQHINFYLDTENYFDYFDYLWHKGNGKITTVGDITPSYAFLPIEGLEKIKNGLEKRGFRVKVIFLMRDPIERCWSSVRMKRRFILEENPNQVFVTTENDDLKEEYKTEGKVIRTQYELTVKNIESVFNKEYIFYGIYESLFTKHSINQLKSFINVPDFKPNIDQIINNSDKSVQSIEKELSTEIFNFYKDTYEFCDKRFDVKKLWMGWKLNS